MAIGELIGNEPESGLKSPVEEMRQSLAKPAPSHFKILLASTNIDLSKSVLATSKKSDCGIRPAGGGTCYRCGVGCECICYLEACVNHDLCVDEYGYLAPRCMGLLAVAVAAMADAGPQCGLLLNE